MITVSAALMSTMYPSDIATTLAAHGIVELSHGHPWPSGLGFVAASPKIVERLSTVDLVVASTCVDHCEGDPELLAATVFADLVHGATVARQLDLPLLSLVGVGQEIRLTPGGKQMRQSWHAVVERVANLFDQLTLPHGSRLVSTDNADVWQLLTSTVELDRASVGDPSLDGLYQLGSDSCFPRGTPFSYFYEYYRYNIATYRKPVVEAVIGRRCAGVLVVENVQQVKTVAAARHLMPGWPLEHLVSLPAPGRSGRDRATRAVGTDRITLAQVVAHPSVSQSITQPDSRAYWQAITHQHAQLTMKGLPA